MKKLTDAENAILYQCQSLALHLHAHYRSYDHAAFTLIVALNDYYKAKGSYDQDTPK